MQNEKKAIISGIKRMEIHGGDGLRTTVFFKGRPLNASGVTTPGASDSSRRPLSSPKNACAADAVPTTVRPAR